MFVPPDGGMEVFMSVIAQRLREAMEAKGLKQVDVIRLAQPIGRECDVHIGKSHMSQYLSGKSEPRKDILSVLAKTLEVDEKWLAGIDDENEPVKPDDKASEKEFFTSKKNKKDAFSKKENQNKKVNLDNAGSDSIYSVEKTVDLADDKVMCDKKSSNKAYSEKIGDNVMRQFSKSSKLDNVLYDVRGPVVEEANRMADAGMHILKLNIGNPAPFGFRAPEEVVYDMRQQLTDCEGYSDSKGLFSARKAIMQYAQLKNIPNVEINDIYTGNGVSELINLSMQALLDDGDEILIPSPDYPLWTATATLAGGKVVHYLCDEQSDWNPDIDDIKKKVNANTKAIVIINPNNPTGALYPKEVLEQIVQIARENQLIIFSDEIYDRLVMDDGEHISIASLAPDVFCVTFSGLSKSHMIAGFRVGWMILSGNKEIAKDYIEGINMLSNMRLCSNVPAQSIVQTALGGYQSVKNYIVPGGRIYEQREFMYKAINDIPGLSVVKPKAAFYAFPKIDVKKFNITNDEKFAYDFLKEKKVLLVHGGGFNWEQPDHFRIVYLPRVEVLEEALGKLGEFLETYRQ